jgi:hypothetical protein
MMARMKRESTPVSAATVRMLDLMAAISAGELLATFHWAQEEERTEDWAANLGGR